MSSEKLHLENRNPAATRAEKATAAQLKAAKLGAQGFSIRYVYILDALEQGKWLFAPPSSYVRRSGVPRQCNRALAKANAPKLHPIRL